VRAIYKNYLSTNALHWYFQEERMRICGERVLGAGAAIELMPFSEHVELPAWCRHMGTTKLLVSKDGHGFALDVGGRQPFDMLRQALADGLIKKIEGIWVTHVHNDHTQEVPAAAREFGCPVYAVAEVADPLENPGAWFLPGLIPEPVDEVIVKKDGEKWTWREFTLTGHFFPGQMYNHGALLVERADHKPVFFIGDTFSPSGIDDYCMMNRNLMREDTGYLRCLRTVRELPVGSWLVNQHIPHLFRFTGTELDFLEDRYRKRAAMIAELVPWDDPNYALDEQWAWFHPYGSTAKAGQRLELELRLWNHSQRERTFEVLMGSAPDLEVVGALAKATIPPCESRAVKVPLRVRDGALPGVRVITAGLRSEGIAVDHWIEALVKVAE
jgi:glyoxylase-like metal-dependent hydrolase (beta-lactamase superfamily II)